jgi:hypothetical protein
MMTVGECRAKALEASANAAGDISAKARLDWELMARQWTDLAGRIELQEAEQCKLSDRYSIHSNPPSGRF